MRMSDWSSDVCSSDLPTDEATDQHAVLADQSPFEAAFREIAERIEGRAAQPLEPGEHAERRQHPRAEAALLRAARGIATRQHRRREVEAQREVATELFPHEIGRAHV